MHGNKEKFSPEVSISSSISEFELLPGVEFLGSDTVSVSGYRSLLYEEDLSKSLAQAYFRGVEKGLEEAKEWKRKARDRVESAVRSILEEKNAMLAELEAGMLKLTVEIARKVIKQEIASDTIQCLRNQIEFCLRQLGGEVPVSIRLNPEDVERVRELVSEEGEALHLLRGVRLVGDRGVDVGGCIMEMERGALRATISEQLDKISEVLEKEYGKSVAGEMGSTPHGGP